jgi:hypothetical protein
MAVRRGDHAMSRSLVAELLDHIDTLTAKLAEAEAERDALRAALLNISDNSDGMGWADLPHTQWWVEHVRPLLEGDQ